MQFQAVVFAVDAVAAVADVADVAAVAAAVASVAVVIVVMLLSLIKLTFKISLSLNSVSFFLNLPSISIFYLCLILSIKTKEPFK